LFRTSLGGVCMTTQADSLDFKCNKNIFSFYFTVFVSFYIHEHNLALGSVYQGRLVS
jgi:hypothetical protein